MSDAIYRVVSTWATKLGESKTVLWYRLETAPISVSPQVAIIDALTLSRWPLAHLFLADSARLEVTRCQRVLPIPGPAAQVCHRLYDGLLPLRETALQVAAQFSIRSAAADRPRPSSFRLFGLDFLTPGPHTWRSGLTVLAMRAFALAMSQPLTAPIGPFDARLQHRSSKISNGINTYGSFSDAVSVNLDPRPRIVSARRQLPKGSRTRISF